MSACCVSGCKNRHSATSKLKFYRIPSGYRPFQANRRRLWLQALERVNRSTEGLKGNVRVCGAHFISGQASMDHDSPDFVPSVFTCTKPSPIKKVQSSVATVAVAATEATSSVSHTTRFYGRRRRRCRKTNAAKEEITTSPRDDSQVDVQTSVLMKTEEGRWSKEAEAETRTKPVTSQTTSSLNKSSLSFKLPAGIPKLDKMNPVVLIKPLHLPVGYQHELGNQSLSVSQLGKCKQPQEEERLFICEICAKQFTCQADFTKHQCVHTDEPSFPCNMCDRSFTTSRYLKRHKLLHVKDGRKCTKCGVLFCRRHNHILFLPQSEPKTKSGQDSSVVESPNVGSNVKPENHPLQDSEQRQSDDVDDDAQGTVAVTPMVTSTVPSPPLNPGPLCKTYKAIPPHPHTRVLSEVPVPVLLKPSSVLYPPPVKPMDSIKQGTPSQLMPPQPDKPVTFSVPHPPLIPELPASLKIFSPKYLTSALLEVKRNYEYILSYPKVRRNVKKDIKNDIQVKVEQCELPLIAPHEQNVVEVKNERTAYDLEIEI